MNEMDLKRLKMLKDGTYTLHFRNYFLTFIRYFSVTRKSTNFLLLFLILNLSVLFLCTSVQSVGLTNVSISVAENKSVEIADFRISKEEIYQHQTLFFTCTVENLGNVQINLNPKIFINGNGVNFTEISLEEITIPIRGNTTITYAWNVGNSPTGKYSAVFCIRNDDTKKYEIKNFSILYDSGGITTIPPTQNGEKRNETGIEEIFEYPAEEIGLKFVHAPILVELRKGEVYLFDVGIKNTGNSIINVNELNFSFQGLPDDWILSNIDSSNDSIPPNSIFHIRTYLTVPKNAEEGDNVVTIFVNNSKVSAKTFFILRVNTHNSEIGKLGLTRIVSVDKETGITNVRLRIENQGSFINSYEVIEEIPETLANNIDQIFFGDPPVEVSESEKVVKWAFNEIEQGSTMETFYSVGGVPEEYSSVIYWPVKQLNVYHLKPVRELDVYWESEILTPENEGDIVVHLFNSDINPMGVMVVVEPMAGWEVFPESITTTIAGEGKEKLIFRIKPPVGMGGGMYQLKSIIRYDEEETVIHVPVRVEDTILKDTDQIASDANSVTTEQNLSGFEFGISGRLFTVIALLAVIVILQTILLIFKFIKNV